MIIKQCCNHIIMGWHNHIHPIETMYNHGMSWSEKNLDSLLQHRLWNEECLCRSGDPLLWLSWLEDVSLLDNATLVGCVWNGGGWWSLLVGCFTYCFFHICSCFLYALVIFSRSWFFLLLSWTVALAIPFFAGQLPNIPSFVPVEKFVGERSWVDIEIIWELAYYKPPYGNLT